MNYFKKYNVRGRHTKALQMTIKSIAFPWLLPEWITYNKESNTVYAPVHSAVTKSLYIWGFGLVVPGDWVCWNEEKGLYSVVDEVFKENYQYDSIDSATDKNGDDWYCPRDQGIYALQVTRDVFDPRTEIGGLLLETEHIFINPIEKTGVFWSGGKTVLKFNMGDWLHKSEDVSAGKLCVSTHSEFTKRFVKEDKDS